LSVERRKNGVDPILTPEHSRRIQFEFETRTTNKYVSVIVLKSVFERMGLHVGDDLQMKEDRLHQSARSLRKTFDVIEHNDRVLKRAKLVNFDSYVRRAWVFGEPFDKCDAILRISFSEKRKSEMTATERHISRLFETSSHHNKQENVEYM